MTYHLTLCEGGDFATCGRCARHSGRGENAEAARSTPVRIRPMQSPRGCMDWQALPPAPADVPPEELT